MKKLLTVLLTTLAFSGFSQVKNFTIHGTKWVRTDSMLIISGDTINRVTEGDTLLTKEAWRTLSSEIKSGYDSSRFNIEDGYVYHYISGEVSDSTILDGRYKLFSDTTYNAVYDVVEVTGISHTINYPVVFGSDYHLDYETYYIDTIGSDIVKINTANYNLIQDSSGFSINFEEGTTFLKYLAVDSTGIHCINGETDPVYTSDSANLVKYSNNTQDLDLGTNSVSADSGFLNSIGIGTILQKYKLSIVSSVATNNGSLNIYNSDFNKNTTTAAQACDTSSFCYSFTATGKPIFGIKGVDGGNIFNIDSVARFGFGTIATSTISVGSTGNLAYRNYAPNNFDISFEFYSNSVIKSSIYWDYSEAAFKIYESGADRFIIKGGNVGIGTTTPTEKLDVNGQSKFLQISATLTDGTPSDAEIDTATGKTPATVGAGYQCTIKDNNGSGLLYKIESDGTDWFYLVMTKAL